MSVSVFQPLDGALAEVVRVSSDAANNYEAIAEIDEWASENGYTRSNEQWLVHHRRDGRTVFLSTCYRETADDAGAIEDRIASRNKARAVLG